MNSAESANRLARSSRIDEMRDLIRSFDSKIPKITENEELRNALVDQRKKVLFALWNNLIYIDPERLVNNHFDFLGGSTDEERTVLESCKREASSYLQKKASIPERAVASSFYVRVDQREFHERQKNFLVSTKGAYKKLLSESKCLLQPVEDYERYVEGLRSCYEQDMAALVRRLVECSESEVEELKPEDFDGGEDDVRVLTDAFASISLYVAEEKKRNEEELKRTGRQLPSFWRGTPSDPDSLDSESPLSLQFKS